MSGSHETTIGGISGAELKQYISRAENLEQEKAEISEQIREVLAEAKGNGYDVKVIRQIMKLRKMKKEEVAEQEELLDLYRRAIGDLSD